jgi:hypothetical protein
MRSTASNKGTLWTSVRKRGNLSDPNPFRPERSGTARGGKLMRYWGLLPVRRFHRDLDRARLR